MNVSVGFDVSTQSCKAIAVDLNDFRVVCIVRVEYDKDLPHFQTVNGVTETSLLGENDTLCGNSQLVSLNRVTSPTVMWVEAMRLAARRLIAEIPHDANVKVVSGSAQQHGSVFWSSGALCDWTDASFDLASMLASGESPIWMDNTTGAMCEELNRRIGAENVKKLTGSAATERFTLHQAVALRQRHPEVFGNVRQIGLVSSFCTSVLVGALSAIDMCDAAGMNAMDISSLRWSRTILDAMQLPADIFGPTPIDPRRIVGHVGVTAVSAEWWDSIFPAGTPVVPFTGDNCCAVVGMGLVEEGDILISLGTSDTCIFLSSRGALAQNIALPFAHEFPHPLDPLNMSFGMIVYANGDLARRAVRDCYCDKSWATFSAMLADPNAQVEYDAKRCEGMLWTRTEISPPSSLVGFEKNGSLYTNLTEDGAKVIEFSRPEFYVRAVIESRAVTIRKHLATLFGDKFAPRKLLLTGGAAANKAIVRIFATVFDCNVIVSEGMNEAAAFGAAVRGAIALGAPISTLLRRLHGDNE